MKKLLFLMLFSAGLFAQAEDSSKWSLDIITGLTKFDWQGNYQLFEAPASGGVQYDFGFGNIGVFITMAASGGEDEPDRLDIGTMLHINFLEKAMDNQITKRIGLGVGFDWWRTSTGVRTQEKLIKDLSFITITLDL